MQGHAATYPGGPSLGLLFPLPHFSGQGLPRRYQKLLPPVVSGSSHSPNWIMIQPKCQSSTQRLPWMPHPSIHPSKNSMHSFKIDPSSGNIRKLCPFISVLNNARIPVNSCEPGIVLVCWGCWGPSPLAPGKTEASSRHPLWAAQVWQGWDVLCL